MKALYSTQLVTDAENGEWCQFVEACMAVGKEEQKIDTEIRDIEGVAY